MDKARWDTIAAAGGILGALLFVVGIVILGTPPGLDDDATAVADFFTDKRGQVLWSVWFQGLGVLAIIWFFAALGAAMRDVGEGRLAAAMGIAFAITFAIGAIAALSRASLGWRVAEDADSGVTLAVYQMTVYMDGVASVIAAGFFAAVGGAIVRTRFLAWWWGWASLAAALLAVIGSLAWGRDGFWSPEGAGFVTFVVFLVWVGFTSILLTLKMRGEAPVPSAMPTT